jgi:hypothetical protein
MWCEIRQTLNSSGYDRLRKCHEIGIMDWI